MARPVQGPKCQPEGACQACRRATALVDALRLEVNLIPAPSQQQLAIQDGLRLLAVWAVQAARKGQQDATGAARAPETGLDFRRPSSEECAADAGALTPAPAKET